MGYYSQVAISMSKENYERLKVFDKENRDLKDLLDIAEIKERNEVIVLSWDSLKWYPDFAGVQAIEEFLASISDRNESYSFIRLGEEIDDTQIERCYGEEDDDDICDAIDVYRGIDVYI